MFYQSYPPDGDCKSLTAMAGLEADAADVPDEETSEENAFQKVLPPIAATARRAAAEVAANPVRAGGTAGLTGGRQARSDDGGLGVVRIKPLGAGGGGGERSAHAGTSGHVSYSTSPASITVTGREFDYPSHVISPEMDQQALYDAFMPPRIRGFLDGVNVNIMAYGQTGSGKTHTVFGPPGILAAAASGALGTDVVPEYGLFPRALIGAFQEVQRRRAAGARLALTASAVELTWDQGNVDMFAKGRVCVKRGWQASSGVNIDKTAVPPRLYGQVEFRSRRRRTCLRSSRRWPRGT